MPEHNPTLARTSDQETTVAELKKIVHEFREERDWLKFDDPYDLAAALSVEAAELLELFLWKKNSDTRTPFNEEGRARERLTEELADVLACVLMLASSTGVDLTTSLRRKMAKNCLKYPVDRVNGVAVDKVTGSFFDKVNT